MTQIDIIFLHLSLMDGIGNSTFREIYSRLQDNIKNIYTYSVSDFIAFGISKHIAEKLHIGLKNKGALNLELDLMKKEDIKFVHFQSDSFPDFLKHHTSISFLYTKGNIDLLKYKQLCIVGSRKSNLYAKQALEFLLKDLVPFFKDSNIVFTSGGALGGDTLAHRYALKNDIKTISVLGSGLLDIYPIENTFLFDEIIEKGGLIVSPFSLKTAPSKWTFPNRNQVLAGLSYSVLVLQAALKSGTLITSHAALEMGKNIGVIPGSILEDLSSGCHFLIKEGASIIQNGKDLLELLDINIDLLKTNHIKLKEEEVIEEKPLSLENEILLFCSDFKNISEINLKFNLSENHLNDILFKLMLNKQIKQDFLGRWKRNDYIK